MNLKIYKSVNYGDTCFFQFVGPGNISLFVKAGLELY